VIARRGWLGLLVIGGACYYQIYSFLRMFYLGWRAILFKNIRKNHCATWLSGATSGGSYRPIADHQIPRQRSCKSANFVL
jgi:hypothetical protein